MKTYQTEYIRTGKHPTAETVARYDEFFKHVGTRAMNVVDEPIQLDTKRNLHWQEFVYRDDQAPGVLIRQTDDDGSPVKKDYKGKLPTGVKLEDYGFVEV